MKDFSQIFQQKKSIEAIQKKNFEGTFSTKKKISSYERKKFSVKTLFYFGKLEILMHTPSKHIHLLIK